MMPPSSMSTLVLMVRLLVMALSASPVVAGQRGALDLDLELHQRAAFIDLRRDLEDGAHFLALHGGEWIHAAVGAAAGTRELSGDERHFLRHLELRFLVVHGHGRRRRDQVGVRVALQSRGSWRRSSRRWPRCGRCRRSCRCRARSGPRSRDCRRPGRAARDSRRPPGIGTCPAECVCRLSSDHTAQFTPSSAFFCTCTSTMMASTSTCPRRMSSLSTTAIRERMTLAGAVITSALVSGSAQMVVERSALAATPPPPPPAHRRPAGAPPVIATVALICSLSLVAIFSASAYCR